MSLRGPIKIGASRQRSTFLSFAGNTTLNLGTAAGGYASVGRIFVDGQDLVGSDVNFIASIRCISASTTGSIFLYDVTDGDTLIASNTITTDVATDITVPLTTIAKTGVRVLEVRAGLDPAGSYTLNDGFSVLSAALQLREY